MRRELGEIVSKIINGTSDVDSNQKRQEVAQRFARRVALLKLPLAFQTNAERRVDELGDVGRLSDEEVARVIS